MASQNYGPSVTVTPASNTWTFPVALKTCVITNKTGGFVYFKLNDAAATVSSSDHDFLIPADGQVWITPDMGVGVKVLKANSSTSINAHGWTT